MASKAWLSDLPLAVEKRMRRLASENPPPAAGPDAHQHRGLPAPYLKRFASDDDQIVVVTAAEPRVTDIRGAAIIDDFYPPATASPSTSGSPVSASAERAFALIDQAVRQPLGRLARADPYPPSRSDRATLALWLAALSVRGPRRPSTPPGPLDPPGLDAIVDQASAADLLTRLERPDAGDSRVAERLLAMARASAVWTGPTPSATAPLEAAVALEAHFAERFWTLLHFPTAGLVTCDRPLKVFRGGGAWPDTGAALLTADEIWFPVDRTTAIIFHSNTLVGEKATQPPGNFPVDQFNQEILSNAHREVYCHPADYERVAELQLAANRKTVP